MSLFENLMRCHATRCLPTASRGGASCPWPSVAASLLVSHLGSCQNPISWYVTGPGPRHGKCRGPGCCQVLCAACLHGSGDGRSRRGAGRRSLGRGLEVDKIRALCRQGSAGTGRSKQTVECRCRCRWPAPSSLSPCCRACVTLCRPASGASCVPTVGLAQRCPAPVLPCFPVILHSLLLGASLFTFALPAAEPDSHA